MKKNKFQNKLTLNKNVISKMEVESIVGAGPTWQITCPDECVTLNAKYYPCVHPMHTDFCAPSEGCVVSV